MSQIFLLVFHICLSFVWIYSLDSFENAKGGKKIEVDYDCQHTFTIEIISCSFIISKQIV